MVKMSEPTEREVAAAEAAFYGKHERGFINRPLISAGNMRAALSAAARVRAEAAAETLIDTVSEEVWNHDAAQDNCNVIDKDDLTNTGEPVASGVRVKALEWTLSLDGWWRTEGVGFVREILDKGRSPEEVAELKAEAQADYERSILSALEPAAPEGEQEVAGCEWCVDGLQADGETPCPTCTRPSEQAVTEEWRPIETAPRNESGQSYGPWLLVFHKYDHGVYQARWECHGDKRGWFAKGEPKSIFSHNITHWMPLPTPPALAQEAGKP